jgi:cadmium resistance protein CadD (predicted permease)
MIETVLTSIVAFGATNIDDIFILTLLYGSRKYSHSQIFVGQLSGIFALVGLSLAISSLDAIVDPRIIGWIGLFPIYLGIRQIIELFQKRDDERSQEVRPASSIAILSIALITIANGGDNVGVYVPLFVTLTGVEKIQLCLIFAVMVYIWCFIARYLADHPLLRNSLDKYAHRVVPIVLVAIGVFVLIESNALTFLQSP